MRLEKDIYHLKVNLICGTRKEITESVPDVFNGANAGDIAQMISSVHSTLLQVGINIFNMSNCFSVIFH